VLRIIGNFVCSSCWECSSVYRIPGFGGSDEAVAAEKVLDCFDQGDAEGMKTCTSQALFTYLDNEVSQRPHIRHITPRILA